MYKRQVLAGLLLAAGLVKFSGLMMLPALGMLGLFRLVQAANKLSLRLWGQFAVIGAGAAVGFAWGWFLPVSYTHLINLCISLLEINLLV